MSGTSDQELHEHGWRAVPRSQAAILKIRESDPSASAKALKVEDIPLPSSDLAKKTQAYVKERLAPETYNHSLRVYYYGRAILKQHFPSWRVSDETYFLACLLHDIGTTHQSLRDTLMSFEFYGGFLALRTLSDFGAPKSQAESVTETIIRHQDLGETGQITELGQIIQLATVFDNIGMNPELVSKETIENVVKAWPRNGWSGCFASTIREEIGLKPWCHTTAIDAFAEKVEGNDLMAPYDK